MIDLTASIVLYKNDPAVVQDVLASFFSHRGEDYHLFLIDNSPTDALRFLRKYRKKNITYIFNRKNIGFGKAHNVCIQLSVKMKSRYHLILNPDILFEPSTLPEAIAYMDAHPDVGLLSPRIFYPDGEPQYLCKLLPSPNTLILRRFIPITHWREKSNRRYELRFWDYNHEADIPSLSGCFMFCRTETLMAIRGFDERYFMYAEDIDFCRRMAEHARLVYYPKISITHHFSRGSYHDAKLLKHHTASVIKYFNKWGWLRDKRRTRANSECLRQLAAQCPSEEASKIISNL